MKTNEAPEKLWINPSIDLPKLNGVIDKNSIQYVRTDAFIEKACEWLRTCNYTFPYKMIEDFKKAMEE